MGKFELIIKLGYVQQFDFKNQRRAGGDYGTHALFAVGHVGWNDQRAFLANTHSKNSFVPTLNDLADPEREVERLVPVTRRVELAPVGQLASIVHAQLIAHLGHHGAPVM